MGRQIFGVIFFIYLTVSAISADGKCQLLPGQGEYERSIVYLCVEVTFDQVEEISSEANWIEFSVSKLHIPEKAFERFSLHTLSFYKCDIRYIDPKAFEGLVHLESLTFWESNIHVLTASWVRGLTSLTHLSLKNTGMVYIEPKTFLEIPHLKYLNIEDNNLNCLPEHALTPLKNLRDVRLGKNPWLCNCHAELVKWMLNRRIDFGTKDASKMKFECMSGWYATNNTKRIEVYRNSSTSESAAFTIGAARDGSCMSKTLPILSPTPDDVGSIKLSGVKVSTIPEFAFFQFGNSLRSLDMSNCSIREIHSEAFAGLPKLEQLILFNNSIDTVKAEWFRDLRGLKHLWLNHNGIKSIESKAFALLDHLETLNLEQNRIECLSTNTFGLLKNLRRVNIAKNPWNCTCLNEFRAWLDARQIAYHVNLGECKNGNSQTAISTGDRYGSGYWNSSFERNFTASTTATEFNSRNFTESYGTSTKFHYDFPTEFESYYERNEGSHQRSKKSSSREEDRPQERLKRQNIAQDCHMSNLRGSLCAPACIRMDIQSYPTRYFYKCSGGTLASLNSVPDTAESIEFEYSTIPVLPNYAFARFGGHLRTLKLWNCRIRTINPQAFTGLGNLQELVINGNTIHEVRSSWFESTRNLQRLILTQNSISRIENSVFQSLPNLQHLVITNNQLNCIGIDSLHYMSRLRMMDVHQNPWSCLCRRKLIEWMDEHRVNYNRDVLGENFDWSCQYPGKNLSSTIRPPTTTWVTTPPTTTQRTIVTMRPQPPPPTPNGWCKMIPPGSSRCRCKGGDTFVLDEIPSDVLRIEIVNITISELKADTFARFKNLRELLFYDCKILKIDDRAFRGLHNLKLLVFQGSSISSIRSSWFHDLTALTELDLANNHLTEIEPDVFQALPNLRTLSLHDNELQCIYTESLSAAKNLEIISLQNNPWKWRCLEEMRQFLDGRNVRYSSFRTYNGKRITCELKSNVNSEDFNGSGTTNTSVSTVNVLCVSIAMLIFTKF